MSYEDATEQHRRDKGKQEMEITTTQDEGSSSQSEELQNQMLEKQSKELQMLEKQLEELQRSEKQNAEAKTKLLEDHIRILEKLVEEHKKELEKQHDEANTKLLEEHKKGLEKQHDEANTKLLEEHKKGLEKQNDRIIGFQSTAFQLTNWYFVSQAAIFSTLAGNVSSMSCRDDVWIPIVLSVLPAIFILCELWSIGNDYRKAIRYRDQSSTAYEILAMKMEHKNARNTNEPPKALDFKRKSSEAIFFYARMFVFFIVACVIAFGSTWRICFKK